MVLITANRIRSMLADCRTNADVAATLRTHKVKFRYDTAPGFLRIVVPTATGTVQIVRRASKTAPFTIDAVAPTPCYRRNYNTY